MQNRYFYTISGVSLLSPSYSSLSFPLHPGVSHFLYYGGLLATAVHGLGVVGALARYLALQVQAASWCWCRCWCW